MDAEYYFEKYLKLCDDIRNKSSELKQCFDEDTEISRIVRSTCNIFECVIQDSKNIKNR